MKKILIIILLITFSSSVYASSCMIMAKAIDDKIEEQVVERAFNSGSIAQA